MKVPNIVSTARVTTPVCLQDCYPNQYARAIWLHVKIYVETKKAKQQQEQKRGCGSEDAAWCLLHKKYNCSKGPGLVAAAAGGNRRVELVCSGCHAVSENGVWVINKPEMCEVQTRHRGEDDRDESIRMKCSGKSAAAGHEGREEFKRGRG